MDIQIAERIKNARNKRGLSVADVAKTLDVTRQTVYNWEETGEIRENSLDDLCGVLKEAKAWIRYGVKESPAFDRDLFAKALEATLNVVVESDIELSVETLVDFAFRLHDHQPEVIFKGNVIHSMLDMLVRQNKQGMV